MVGARGFEPPTTWQPMQARYQAALRPEVADYSNALMLEIAFSVSILQRQKTLFMT